MTRPVTDADPPGGPGTGGDPGPGAAVPPQPASRPPWGVGAAVAGEGVHFLLELALGALAAAVLMGGFRGFPERAWQVLPSAVLAWAALLLGGRALLRARGVDPAPWIPLRPSRPLPRGFMVLAVVVVAGLIPLISLPDAVHDTPLFRLIQGPADRISLALFALTVAPVAEELWYRGFVYAGVRRSLGPGVAVVAVGLWFGLIHAPEYAGAPFGILSLCAMGVATTWIRERTGAVGPCIVVHLAHNAVGVLGLFLGE